MEGDSETMRKGMSLRAIERELGIRRAHHQEIHGCRRSSGAAVPAGSHCVNIQYSGRHNKVDI